MDKIASTLSDVWSIIAASRLSPGDRVVGAVGPAVALLAYVALAYLWFVVSGARRTFVDKEAENRKTGLTSAGLRVFFSWAMRPWINLLLRAELPPNAITTVSLGISLASGVALAAGRFSVGGWLFFAAGACDFFDGRIARAKNIASSQGAALDSIVDRYSESAVLVGLAWYYRDSWVLFPALLALTGSLLVPYVRAKAEALQVALQEVGWLQRPERVVLLATTTALAPLLEVAIDPNNPKPLHGLTVLGLLVLAVGTQLTAGQRTRALLQLLAPEAPRVAPARGGLRAIGASIAATGADALLVAALTANASRGFLPAATALGCLLGAFVNFTLNRHWAFQATEGSLSTQARRYALTSITGAFLNAGGVAVMLLLPSVPSALAWILVRGTVFGVWTLPLFKTYVFALADAASEPLALELPPITRG